MRRRAVGRFFVSVYLGRHGDMVYLNGYLLLTTRNEYGSL